MEESNPSKPEEPYGGHLFWHIFGVVTTLLLVGLGSYYFENIKDHFPDLITGQLWVYNRISHWEARKARPKWVVGVEIDNRTFFQDLHLNGQYDITDRGFLAHVIDNAVAAKAAVIALDINLTREQRDTDDSLRRQKNRALYDAIYRAQQAHVPVVLTFGFDPGSMTPLDENITDPAEPDVENAAPSASNDLVAVTLAPENSRQTITVPVCVDLQTIPVDAPRAGLDRGAEDMRKVPLAHDGVRNGQLVSCASFALQVVDAFERTTGITPLTRARFQWWIEHGQFVYTAFLGEKDFPRVSAADVYNGRPDALRALHHRIVLIGGNRSQWPDSATMIDNHPSPAGQMAGMYYHANYIEGLLDDRIKAPVGRGKMALIDVLLAALVMWLVWRLRRKPLGGQLAFLVGVFVAIALAYVTFVNFGFVVDGFAMLVLLVLHTIYEHYLHLLEHRHA
ncbi:MAG: CHASE2 domain-containing protein [Candidatus Korobacteraceae bacterium]